MAPDQVTRVTNKSWFNRLGEAFKGIIFGLLIFIIAFPLLFWNEGRSVRRYITLQEGEGAVVEISSDMVDAANEEALVHLTGKADTDVILTDSVFGVSANALKLRREVEMYQWEETSRSETRQKLGGGEETVTTYTYSKVWSGTPINSARFQEPTGHQNPGAFPYESLELTAKPVTLDAFVLSDTLVTRISNYEPFPVGTENPPAQNAQADALDGANPETEAAQQPADAISPQSPFTPFGGGYYIGANPTSPQIGDMKILFRVVKPHTVSVIAKQAGNSFGAYETKTGTIQLLQTGAHTAADMFAQAQEENKTIAWLLRLLGFILMLVGLNMVLRPLSVVASVLPFAGRLVAAGTGIIAFLVAAILSLLTIAIAWIFYRPLLGITLLVVAVGLMFPILKRMKSAKAEKAAQAAAAAEAAPETA